MKIYDSTISYSGMHLEECNMVWRDAIHEIVGKVNLRISSKLYMIIKNIYIEKRHKKVK